jgi:hypothetical protein
MVHASSSAPREHRPPPARPRSEAELGFVRQSFVRWFHPIELLRAGVFTLLGDLFGSFADKREMQAALNLPERGRMLQYAGAALREDFWLDFVADIGDGFNATYSIALLLARETLAVNVDGRSETTRRGRILLMGGDEVYPSASKKNYLDRSVGPYRAALPYIADEAHAPHLYALPGNHDWYDGLSAFLRQFAQYDRRWIGAWRTQQRRSYFARKLPRDYWLWGVDIQLHADIDSPQLGYFHDAAQSLAPGDRVILATAEPSWVKEAEGEHGGYQSLLRLMREIEERKARVVLVLTGDSHHYARYVDGHAAPGTETHFITAGGGGAFLHGTHTLPRRILLPVSSDPAQSGLGRELKRSTIFPSAAISRQLIRSRIWLFPRTNLAFAFTWALPWAWLCLLLWTGGSNLCDAEGHCGIVSRLAHCLEPAALASVAPLLIALALIFIIGVGLRVAFAAQGVEQAPDESESAATSAVTSPTPIEWRQVVDVALWSVLGLTLFAIISAGNPSPLRVLVQSLERDLSASALVLLLPALSAAYVSRPYEREWLLVGRVLLGLLHGSLYIACWLLAACALAKANLALGWHEWFWLISTPLLAAVMSTLSFAGCLWFAGQYQRALLNDAFSAIGVEDFKNFLRLKIDPSGSLTLYGFGLRRVARTWRIEPEGAPGDPYLRPTDIALEPHLIERIVIPAATAQGGSS